MKKSEEIGAPANALGNPSFKEMIFREFYSHLAIVESQVEIHGSMWDYPVSSIAIDADGKETKDKDYGKYKVMLTMYATKAHEGLGMWETNYEPPFVAPTSGYYQDEWSNIEGNAPLPASGCNCPVCSVKVKKIDQWDEIDTAIAAAAIDFMKKWYEDPKIEKEEYEATVSRRGVKKSMNKLLTIVNKMKDSGKTNDEIKDVVRKAYSNVGDVELFGKSDYELFPMRDSLEKPLDDFYESNGVSVTTDILDFSNLLEKR